MMKTTHAPSEKTTAQTAQTEPALRAGQSAASAVVLAIEALDNTDAEPLLWASIAGRPLVAWSIEAFEATAPIRAIALVVPPVRLHQAQELIVAMGWRRVRAVPMPGARWRDAVLAGLAALPADDELVVLHHGNRPFVTPELIERGMTLAAQFPGSGAVACEPVKETIKQVIDEVVVATPPRVQLALLQTPQVFPRAPLLYACQRHDLDGDRADTSDAAIFLAAQGLRIHTFSGGHDDLAVRWPDDLAVAEARLRQRTD